VVDQPIGPTRDDLGVRPRGDPVVRHPTRRFDQAPLNGGGERDGTSRPTAQRFNLRRIRRGLVGQGLDDAGHVQVAGADRGDFHTGP